MTLDFGMPANAAAAIHAAVTQRKPCDVCHGSGVINFEAREMPCPMCRPAAAREASAIYDHMGATS